MKRTPQYVFLSMDTCNMKVYLKDENGCVKIKACKRDLFHSHPLEFKDKLFHNPKYLIPEGTMEEIVKKYVDAVVSKANSTYKCLIITSFLKRLATILGVNPKLLA